MMKKIITKSGSTIYISETPKLGYTAEKLEIINEFTKMKPLMKATNDELVELVKKVLGQQLTATQCRSCSRNKWITMLKAYQDVATKLLTVEAPKEEETEQQPEETEQPKKKKGGRKK